MKRITIFGLFFLMLSVLAFSLPDYADAARMGGGRSFGGRPSMSRPAPPPAATRQQTQAQSPVSAPNRGLFGGMGGGLLGGLLAGSLIGSLLGGHGFAGGGFMDLILLGLLAFLAFKLYKKFRGAGNPAEAPAGAPSMHRQSTSSNWDFLRGSASNSPASFQAPFAAQTRADIPQDFNAEEFLRGAKMAYTRMQKSWDERDLNDISHFVTPVVLNELQKQMQDDPNPSHTEIMLVNAELIGVEREGDEERAQVYFDVMMRENPNQSSTDQVREIWHFLRKGKDDGWRLDGIQQVE